MKSKFKRQMLDNIDMLKDFEISYKEDKFYLDEQIVEFERAITNKDIEKAKYKEWVSHIKETYRNINKDKKGQILKKKLQIIDLIKNKLNNNDYLMIKGSNSTGLHKLVVAIKTGRTNAL